MVVSAAVSLVFGLTIPERESRGVLFQSPSPTRIRIPSNFFAGWIPRYALTSICQPGSALAEFQHVSDAMLRMF